MFWEVGKVEMMLDNKNPFSANITIAKLIFYLPHGKPIMLTNDYKEGSMESYDLTMDRIKRVTPNMLGGKKMNIIRRVKGKRKKWDHPSDDKFLVLRLMIH